MSKVDDIRREAKLRRLRTFKYLESEAEKDTLPKLKKLDIPFGKKVASGTHVDIYISDKLEKLYDRKKICLKIFKNSKAVWGSISREGVGTIMESTMVQNLMAIKGLAPRVYDLVSIKGKTAQVTDYLQGDQKVVSIIDDRFEFNQGEIKKDYNFVAGKLVDFQAAKFKDATQYKIGVLKRALCVTQWPQGQAGLYQSADYFDGKRNTKERIELYNFKDFKNKRVLDIGCNLGMFCREAARLGSKRVIGLDFPEVIEITKELAILDGYFNIDFYGLNLKECLWSEIISLTKLKRFDIFLFLAMEMWIGRPEWINKCKTLYFEGHGVKREVRVEHF